MARFATIRNLAGIQLGYQLRTKPEENRAGDVLLIQLKDVNKSRTRLEVTEGTVRFDPERSIEKQLLHEGDVLFMGKGSKPFACTVRGLTKPAVATGMFFILRPDTKLVLPDYLAWVLNQEKSLTSLLIASGTGVAMPVIRRRVLEEFSIPLPPLTIQRKISELQRLMAEEKDLLCELAAQREELIRGVCEKWIGGI